MKNKFLEALQKLQERKELRKKQLEEIEKEQKQLKGRIANLHFLDAECNRLRAETEKIGEIYRRQVERLKTKPRKWRGELGYHFICAVKALTADGTSEAQAFRDLHSWAKGLAVQSQKARFELVSEYWRYLRDECCKNEPRQLAVRYCNASKAWGPFFERDDALDAEMERFRAISDAAMSSPSIARMDEN
jgi:DNA repair exonuclease SbcCD ATPase subunit